jgi:glyoxylase-like metal-dependent hydrolase (beta-lactamase superfamily II)
VKFQIIPVTAFQQNCTLLWDDASREAFVIDPGGEPERIRSAIEAEGLAVTSIVLTHGHLDHVGASAPLAKGLGVPIIGPHRDDAFLIDALRQQCVMFGFPPVESFQPERWLEDGEMLGLGGHRLRVVHCPGHTPGHVVLVDETERIAQVGDVLFRGSIGRTDFPRGNHRDLLQSIRSRLFPLGDDIRFIPGHGPMSTFGAERRDNPYVAEAVAPGFA